MQHLADAGLLSQAHLCHAGHAGHASGFYVFNALQCTKLLPRTGAFAVSGWLCSKALLWRPAGHTHAACVQTDGQHAANHSMRASSRSRTSAAESQRASAHHFAGRRERGCGDEQRQRDRCQQPRTAHHQRPEFALYPWVPDACRHSTQCLPIPSLPCILPSDAFGK